MDRMAENHQYEYNYGMGLLTPRKLTGEETEGLIQKNLQWLLSVTSPSAVIVFGSAARRQMTEASDIDIALIYPDEQSLVEARKHIYGSMDRDSVFWPRDLLFYTEPGFVERRRRGGVCELISSEGRVFFGRMP